ncbi:hypothetical protein quinque_007360 [Culex quinquefasciatus]
MAEDCDKAPKGGDVEKASSKTASPAPQQKSGGGGASPNKAAKAADGVVCLLSLLWPREVCLAPANRVRAIQAMNCDSIMVIHVAEVMGEES